MLPHTNGGGAPLDLLDLDDGGWAQLEHAYGSAADIPALLRQLKSKTNQAILEAMGGELAAAPYLVRGVGAYAKRHGLPLDKGLIEVRR